MPSCDICEFSLQTFGLVAMKCSARAQNKTSRQVETLRFTRALFGLVQSLFLLAGTLIQHLEPFRTEYPKEREEIRQAGIALNRLIMCSALCARVCNPCNPLPGPFFLPLLAPSPPRSKPSFFLVFLFNANQA